MEKKELIEKLNVLSGYANRIYMREFGGLKFVHIVYKIWFCETLDCFLFYEKRITTAPSGERDVNETNFLDAESVKRFVDEGIWKEVE